MAGSLCGRNSLCACVIRRDQTTASLRGAGWAISRRAISRWTIIAAAMVCALGLIESSSAHAGRPNLLFIVTDDQCHDTIAALGHPQIKTPHLDQLVARGFAFRNAYCQGGQSPAVCVPSRVMLLTGRSTFRTPPYGAKEYAGPTLGKTFQEAGYATIAITKPGNSFRPAHREFEQLVEIPHVGPLTNARCTDAAIESLNKVSPDKPFCLYFAPSMPHDPRTAEPEFHAQYKPEQIVLPKNFLARQPVDIGVLGIRDEQLAAYPREAKEMQQHLAEYYACITSLDHHLGRLLEAIRTRGQLEQTLIVFTSDQGLAVGGRHGLMGKQNLYEHFKSPLLLAGPGVPKGQSAALVYLYDLYPTVCELCGVAIPAECDGQSLGPILRGEKSRVRDSLFAVYMDSQRMARDERWKLLWYPRTRTAQLFDLQSDPDELINLAERPEAADQLARMKSLLKQEQARFGDPLRN